MALPPCKGVGLFGLNSHSQTRDFPSLTMVAQILVTPYW
jgi:hypothetical protein